MPPYRAYIFDLDGTVYRGSEAIPGAVETVNALREQGAIIRYLTNNSSQTREFFVQKLSGMGFRCEPHEVVSSSIGTAHHLVAQGLDRVFVVGEPGLVQTLREHGITVVNAGHDDVVEHEGGAAHAVVVGIHRTFTYAIMSAAMQRIRSGAHFVATNADTTFPLEGDKLVPGAGSVVAAIRACSEVDPFIVGKPNPFLIEYVMEEAGLRPEETLVVGDRLDTDIESGQRAGCPTHLVLTGVATVAPESQNYSPDLTGLL